MDGPSDWTAGGLDSDWQILQMSPQKLKQNKRHKTHQHTVNNESMTGIYTAENIFLNKLF